MSLLFNMLSRLVITFLPRRKHLLISWLQSPPAVILEPKKLNTFTELKQDLKWALGSITTNKANGDDGIPVELFQVLKDDAVKVLHSICQQFWKTQAVATGLEKVSFHSNPKERQCQRMLKLPHNLHSSHTLAK